MIGYPADSGSKGRRKLLIPPMCLVVFRREDLAGYTVEPLEFIAQAGKEED